MNILYALCVLYAAMLTMLRGDTYSANYLTPRQVLWTASVEWDGEQWAIERATQP